MNATNGVTKVLVCGLTAVALTVGASMSFVESTARAFYASDMPTVVVLGTADHTSIQLVRNDSAGLLQ